MEEWMPPLLGMQINQVMLLGGVGLFLLVLINRLRRGFAQARRQPAPGRGWRSESRSSANETRTREGLGSARLRSAAALAVQESWEVEMHRTARDLKAEIDTKMRALEQLIQLADRARGELDASIERAESSESLNGPRWSDSSEEARRTDRRQGNSAPHAESRAKTARAARDAVSSTRLPPANDPADDPRFERVYALADAGFSATKIAGQVGSQVGEVELILSLRRAG
jgi:hypothetical protein